MRPLTFPPLLFTHVCPIPVLVFYCVPPPPFPPNLDPYLASNKNLGPTGTVTDRRRVDVDRNVLVLVTVAESSTSPYTLLVPLALLPGVIFLLPYLASNKNLGPTGTVVDRCRVDVDRNVLMLVTVAESSTSPYTLAPPLTLLPGVIFLLPYLASNKNLGPTGTVVERREVTLAAMLRRLVTVAVSSSNPE